MQKHYTGFGVQHLLLGSVLKHWIRSFIAAKRRVIYYIIWIDFNLCRNLWISSANHPASLDDSISLADVKIPSVKPGRKFIKLEFQNQIIVDKILIILDISKDTENVWFSSQNDCILSRNQIYSLLLFNWLRHLDVGF